MNNDINPTFINNGGLIPPLEYQKWLKSLKSRYRSTQAKASVKVNNEMLRFYWSLGRDIVGMKIEQHWGNSIIKKLSLDLKAEFGQQGFSESNIYFMKRWYLFYANDSLIFDQAGQKLSPDGCQFGNGLDMPDKFALIPWRHHVEIIKKCHSVREALFYIEKTIDGNWSRRMLEDQIESNLYARQGAALTNFSSKLPSIQSKLAEEVLKDPYKLDFLRMKEGYDEKDLEEALANNITR